MALSTLPSLAAVSDDRNTVGRLENRIIFPRVRSGMVDPQVQQAMKRMVKANRQVIAAMGMLMMASLNATKAMQKLNQEVERSGHWKEASSEEAEQVEGELNQMVATYSSQVN